MKNLHKKGFTLIEMLIVVVIIGILAAALIPRLGNAKGRANDSARSVAINQIGTALGTYVLDYGIPNSITSGASNSSTYTGLLAQGGMAVIPGDPISTRGFTFGGLSATSGAFLIFPVRKGFGTGFAIVANVESIASANWYSTGDSLVPRSNTSEDMGLYRFCRSVKESEVNNVLNKDADCVAPNSATLLKIVVY